MAKLHCSNFRIITAVHDFLLFYDTCTDQPKKKALFSRFATVHPFRDFFFFFHRENKNHLFRQEFSLRRHSARLREETLLNFAMGR